MILSPPGTTPRWALLDPGAAASGQYTRWRPRFVPEPEAPQGTSPPAEAAGLPAQDACGAGPSTGADPGGCSEEGSSGEGEGAAEGARGSTEGGAAAGAAECPQGARAPRKRKRKKAALTQEEQDARFPGNARNRAAVAHVSAAFAAFSAWLSAALEQAEPPGQEQGQGQEVAPPPHVVRAMLARKVQPGSECTAVDWVALRGMCGVVKPRFQLQEGGACCCPAPAAPQQQLPGSSSSNLFGSLIGNPCSQEVLATAHEARVLVPPRARFVMGDLLRPRTLSPLLPPQGEPCGTVVADPPWENASAKRSSAYRPLPARALAALPIKTLLHPEGTLCLWMTNRERLWRCLADELLPAWGLEHVATWWWCKLQAGGACTVSPLASMHRHPFEPLLLLRRPGSTASAQALSDGLVLFSVPQEHSRKPHLGPLLDALVPGSAAKAPRLELFARELHTGWTAVGDEVLKFADAALFSCAS